MLDNPEPRIVVGSLVRTRGEDHLVVTCPECRHLHRHLGVGLRRPQCGGRAYEVRLEPPGKAAVAPIPARLAAAA